MYTASSVVGGWAVLYVGVFLRPVGEEPFFCFYNTGLPLVLGSTTFPTAALLCSLLPYVLLHCRTAAVLYIYIFEYLHTEDDTFTGTYVLLHCRTAARRPHCCNSLSFTTVRTTAAVLSFLFCKTYIIYRG